MSAPRVHAESGVEVRRVGPPACGGAVVVVTAPGTSAARLDALAPFTDAVRADGRSAYVLVWSAMGPERAGVGAHHLAHTVLPRAFRRIARDAALGPDGPLHLVGLGAGGTLTVMALSEHDGTLPWGAVVLVSAVADPRRAPVSRRQAAVFSDARLVGHVVSRANVAAVGTLLGGPRRWADLLSRAVDDGLAVPTGAVSGALLSDLSQPLPALNAVRRPLLVLAGGDDPVRSPAACLPVLRRWAGPARSVVVAGARPPLHQLALSHAVVARHLAGARP